MLSGVSFIYKAIYKAVKIQSDEQSNFYKWKENSIKWLDRSRFWSVASEADDQDEDHNAKNAGNHQSQSIGLAFAQAEKSRVLMSPLLMFEGAQGFRVRVVVQIKQFFAWKLVGRSVEADQTIAGLHKDLEIAWHGKHLIWTVELLVGQQILKTGTLHVGELAHSLDLDEEGRIDCG